MIVLSCLILGCRSASETPHGYLVVSQEQQASWVQNFNPFLSGGLARWPTTAGIYEPMMIYSPLAGEYVPWLATQYRWNDDATELQFTLRTGVLWSDGASLTASDVAYTFELMKNYPAFDLYGVWNNLEHIQVEDNEIRFTFSEPFASGLDALAHQPIVPKHIWSAMEDPLNYANPNPVASGPYTEVLHFESQLWDLGQNPHYWQDLSQSPKALRFPAFPSNEQASLALLQGEVDWAGNFLPAIDRIYTARDPQNFHYWFPLLGTSVLLYPNHTHPFLGDVSVRKALSYAIDRKKVVQIAMHNYTQPAPVTGLSPAYGVWNPAQEDWTQHDIKKARSLLIEAGYAFDDKEILRDSKGQPVSVTLSVVSGWSDWVRAAQVIARQLSQLGIQTRVEGRDFGAWFSALQKGEFELSLGWSTEGPSPHTFYSDLMSAQKYKDIGQVASVNWHRFSDPPTDVLIERFERTPDPKDQKQIIQKLQERFIQYAPAIPIFLNPSWGECNHTRFVGWPSEDNPYARLSPNNPPETLMVMTRVKIR